ncbi:MAG: class I SAM-dependent methyltransferase [Nitrospinales bacterium]
MKGDHLLDPVKNFFTAKFQQIGARPEGVDYNSETAQITRFEQFERLFGAKRRFSLNDYGCGYGAMAVYLKQKDYTFQYHGYDISAKMVDYANQSISNNENWKFTSNADELCSADFTIACGVFNLKFDADPLTWIDYILDSLLSIARISKLGFGFNMLTKYSDADKMRPDLYYGDPLYFFDYCKRQFSRNVALLHDYELYDFTILVRL